MVENNSIDDNFDQEYLKKAILTYPPRWITIGITSACDNRCLFCAYHGETSKEKSNAYNIPFMLSLDDFKRMVDMVYAGGVRHVHICGTGEPFYNPNIISMIDYVIKVYGKVSFQTNFNKDLFERKNYLTEIIKRQNYIEYIATDVCSSLPEEHEYIKKGSKYQDVFDALEFISARSNINIVANLILVKSNCQNVKGIVDEFVGRGIHDSSLSIVNLLPYNFSEFTSSDNVYTSMDTEITKRLDDLVEYGKEMGVCVHIPKPADKSENICSVFWEKLQTWPVKGCDEERFGENMIPLACAAVVKGELNSLGYIFDYDNIMDAWNSPKFVEIRTNLLEESIQVNIAKTAAYVIYRIHIIRKRFKMH